MKQQYYGEYQSALTTSTGCVKKFVVGPQETMQFHPQVQRECDLCDSNHQFYLQATHSVSSERQVDQLLEWASNSDVEVIES